VVVFALGIVKSFVKSEIFFEHIDANVRERRCGVLCDKNLLVLNLSNRTSFYFKLNH